MHGTVTRQVGVRAKCRALGNLYRIFNSHLFLRTSKRTGGNSMAWESFFQLKRRVMIDRVSSLLSRCVLAHARCNVLVLTSRVSQARDESFRKIEDDKRTFLKRICTRQRIKDWDKKIFHSKKKKHPGKEWLVSVMNRACRPTISQHHRSIGRSNRCACYFQTRNREGTAREEVR